MGRSRPRRAGWPAALGLGLGLGLAACAAPRPARLFNADQPQVVGQYPSILATWTRSAKVYHHLENKLFITATFHAPELRRAFAMSFPDIYGHGGDITRSELVELSGLGDESHNFMVSIYTPQLSWNDLARADSIWHLSLRSSADVEVRAQQLVPVKADANLSAVYPYIGRFDRLYLVRFPLFDARRRLLLDATTTRMTLRIASALGAAQLVWDLDIGQPQPAPSPPPPWLPAGDSTPF